MATKGRDERVGGERWNRLLKEVLDWYQKRRQMLYDAMLVDGFPPFTERNTPLERYHILLAMQQSNDPAYWNDPAAQAELAKLSQQFGPPPPLQAPPYGVQIPNRPSTQEQLTALSAKLGPASLVGTGAGPQQPQQGAM